MDKLSVTVSRTSNAYGQTFGNTFGGAESYSITYPNVIWPLRPKKRATYGFGAFGSRVFGRPENWSPIEPSPTSSRVNVDITISTVSGAIVGKIRSDVRDSLIKSLEFTVDRAGSGDFVLELNSAPAFPILPFSTIQVSIGNTEFGWYKAVVDYPEHPGTPKEVLTFRGMGMRKALERITNEGTYASGQDVGEIVATIGEDQIAVETGIGYNATKVNTSTGVIIATDNDISSNKVSKVLETYATMASCYAGVDGDGELFFEVKPDVDELQGVLVAGYHFDEIDIKPNIDSVFNSIIVQRKNEAGAGWAVIGVYNDETSIRKYGLREKRFQVPGSFGDDTGDFIGAALLEEFSELKYSAEVKGIPLRDGEDYLYRGNYLLINPPGEYTAIFDECDATTNWSKTGSGDLAISVVDDPLVDGAGAIKLDFTSANGDVAEVDSDFYGTALALRIWLRSSTDLTGRVATVGYGLTSWDENTRAVNFGVSGTYFQLDWDLSADNVTRIGEVGIRIDTDSAGSIFVDKIEIYAKGNEHYTLELNEWTARINPNDGAMIDAKFGPLPPRSYDFVAQAIAAAEENQFTAKAS